MTHKFLKNFLFSLWLIIIFSFLVFSQTDDIGVQLGEVIVSVVVILTIVLILLYLGGILKFKEGGILGKNLPLILYMILIIIIFVLPILERLGFIDIFPDDLNDIFYKDKEGKEIREEYIGYVQSPLPQPLCKIFTHLNVSEVVACYMPAFIYFFILPFTAIYAITWAFLKQLKIFEGLGRSIEGLIAFIITFMTLPMGTFILLVAFWFSVAGAFSVAVFIAMFLVGVFFRGYGFISSEAYSVGLKLRAQRSQAALRRVEALLNDFEKLTLDELKEQLKDLRDVYKDLEPFLAVFPTKFDIDGIKDKNELKSKLEEIRKKLKG